MKSLRTLKSTRWDLTLFSVATLILAAPVTMAQGPLAWWAFDEISGTVAVDSTGNGHDATLIGGAVFDPVGGLFSGAVMLDGSSGLVEVPDADELEFPAGQDFTITVFYNGPDSDTNNGLVTKGYGNATRSPDGYYLLQVTNPNQFEFDSRGPDALGPPRVRTGLIGPDITDGNWHNVTVVRDYSAGANGEIRSYVDGVLASTIAMTVGGQGDWNMGVNSDTLQIGDHFDRFTSGSFDDVALWDRALSEAEIAGIVSNGVSSTIDAVAVVFRGPSTVLLGEPATLQWVVAPGASVTIDQGIGDVTAMTDAEGKGSIAVTPAGATTYTLTAEKGAASEQLETTVDTRLIASFESSAGSIPQGGSVTLSWRVASAAAVTIDQGIGDVGAQTVAGVGSIDLNPGGSATYTLTASFAVSDETAMVTVNVIDATEGPIAYWPFDEVGGTTAADLSGSLNEHPAELNAGVVFDPAGGRFGGAVVFDGFSGEIRAPDHEDYEFPQGQDFSITLFYNGPDTNTNDGLISKGYGDNPRSNDGYYLLMVTDNGSYEFDSRCCAGGTPRARSGTAGPNIADEQWHNITLVRDYGAGEIRSYIDGVLTSTIVLNPTDGGDWNMGVNTEDVVIGDHLERFTTGKIDEVAIWRRVLSEAEITEIAANGVGGSISKQKLRFSVARSGADMLTLDWESQGGKLYNVRSAVDPSTDPTTWAIYEGNQDLAATPPENTLTFPRPGDDERFFVVEEFDAPPVSIFSDDFENGQGAWTTGSEGVAGTAWQLGAPAAPGPAAANSPNNCFGTNLTSAYTSDVNVWLRSPVIDLTTAGGATLRYARFVDIEITFDVGTVSVLDAADDSVVAVLESTIEGFSGDWENVSKVLPQEALDKLIKIEFRLETDDFDATPFAGFYVDDPTVTVP